MKTLIEVGANYGNDTANFLNMGYEAYAFEPNPELIAFLQERFKDNERFNLVPLAADYENRFTRFNIASGGDKGCSSLYDFTDNIHEQWAGRPDFVMTDSIVVQTIRLDDFMDLYGIRFVDYLWIDAQGNDFRVLQSLGDRLYDVLEGKCEGAYTVDLYSGVENSCLDIAAWLNDRGYETTIRPDNVGKEADVHFRRQP